MIKLKRFEDMTVVQSLLNYMTIATEDQVYKFINDNLVEIETDIIPHMRKFKDEAFMDMQKALHKTKIKFSKIRGEAPVWTPGTDVVEFVSALRNFIKRIPDVGRLRVLNKLQKHVDVKIINPNEPAPKNMKYTIGEMAMFLNGGLRGPGSRLIVSDSSNPMYTPIKYEFPEEEIANTINAIWEEHDISRVILNYAKVFNVYDQLDPADRTKRTRAIIALLDFYRRIVSLRMDPGFMKKFVKNDEGEYYQLGPMEKYEFANLDKIIRYKFDRAVTRTKAGFMKNIDKTSFAVSPETIEEKAAKKEALKPQQESQERQGEIMD